jgi:hypothetical protein
MSIQKEYLRIIEEQNGLKDPLSLSSKIKETTGVDISPMDILIIMRFLKGNMNLQNFKETYIKVIKESTEEILSENKPNYDLVSGSPASKKEATENMLRDKFDDASADLKRADEAIEDLIVSYTNAYTNAYIEDDNFKNNMKDTVSGILRTTIRKFQSYLDDLENDDVRI